MEEMKRTITEILEESIRVKRSCIEANADKIAEAARMLAVAFAGGHKVLIFGNGGSAADAQHIAAEFVNRFQVERPPLAALALTTDTSVITSIGNDYHFDEIFRKQVLALGQKGDIAWGISTSGNSENVVRAMTAARENGLRTLAMTGSGGVLCQMADLTLPVPSNVTARIQETHITVGHMLCDLTDRILHPEAF